MAELRLNKKRLFQSVLKVAVSTAEVKYVSLFKHFLLNTSPLEEGGETTLDNQALACQGCNNHKYNKTEERDPVSVDVVSLYHPRKQQWSDHFAWSNNFTLIVGLTPVGRTTVEALQLNREGIVNLRRLLYAMGDHPPAESNEQDY